MKLQRIVRITSLVVILLAGILLYLAQADDGVYCWNHDHVTVTETTTEAVALNDVRVNVSTPPGYYTGFGDCLVWVNEANLRDDGPIWARVYSSGWNGSYTVRERSARVSGPAPAVTHGATASGHI